MRRAWCAAALTVLIVVMSGCGTMANLSIGANKGWKNALIYGGVRRDVQTAEDFVANNWTPKNDPDLQQDVGTIVGVGLVGLDVPISAIADTLTLPITIPAAIWGSSAAKPNVSARANPPAAPPVNP